MPEKIELVRKTVAELQENEVFRPNFSIPVRRGKPVNLFFAPHPEEVDSDGKVVIITVEQVPDDTGGFSSRMTMLVDANTIVTVIPDSTVVGELTKSRKRVPHIAFGFAGMVKTQD